MPAPCQHRRCLVLTEVWTGTSQTDPPSKSIDSFSPRVNNATRLDPRTSITDKNPARLNIFGKSKSFVPR